MKKQNKELEEKMDEEVSKIAWGKDDEIKRLQDELQRSKQSAEDNENVRNKEIEDLKWQLQEQKDAYEDEIAKLKA